MNARTHTIIPDSENHCVWMDAGVVDYKLCNCGFQCETCPFDAIMRAQHQTFEERAARQFDAAFPQDVAAESCSRAEDAAGKFLQPLADLPFPDDRMYFSNHTWMQSMPGGLFRVGIDAFIARLLHPVSGVATIHAPSHIGRGEPFAWLIRDSATFAVLNNEMGISASINTRLMDHPSLVTGDPYHEGWLMTLVCSGQDSVSQKYFTAKEFHTFIAGEKDELAGELSRHGRHVGATMYDGGTRIESMEEFIGDKRYTKILSRLLSPH